MTCVTWKVTFGQTIHIELFIMLLYVFLLIFLYFSVCLIYGVVMHSSLSKMVWY